MSPLFRKTLAASSLVAMSQSFVATGNAATFSITFTGVVSSFVDQTGVYGTPGTDLSGKPFTNVFIIDTDNATYSSGPSGPQYTMYSANLPSGANAAYSTISGHTVGFNSNVFDFREQYVSPNPYNFSLQEAQAEGFNWLYANSSGYSYAVTVLRDEPLSYSLAIPLALAPYTLAIDNTNGPVYGFGSFQIFTVAYDYGTQQVTQGYNVGYFDERSVSVVDLSRESAAGVVPVPGAMPLFLTGIAGLGWLARRKRKRAAA